MSDICSRSRLEPGSDRICLLMKELTRARYNKRAPRSYLIYVFALLAGCCLVGGALAISRPWQSVWAGVRGQSTFKGQSVSKSKEISEDGVWRNVDQSPQLNSSVPQRGAPRSYKTLELRQTALSAILRNAPMEFSAASRQKRILLTLPSPDGSFSRFEIVESPILAPELAARFPEIKTYSGKGIDDATATTRFDWTPTGFHALVLSTRGTFLIEPAAQGDRTNHIVYFQSELPVGHLECAVPEGEQEAAIEQSQKLKPAGRENLVVSSAPVLKTYRLAVAATAEYTQAYGGGTVAGGLSAITTTINLVNAIYERDLAIRLTLIANETAIIFTDTTTDDYTSDNVGLLIGQNQVKLDSVIGSDNYDIGHVFDGRLLSGGAFSWQGQGSIGAVCRSGLKGRGVDIFRSLTPGNVYAYYSAAHEIGHQFGATHTFNATTGTCGSQRTAFSAYEPANGSTIMAYRLACSPEDLRSTDTYFHANSIDQIVLYTGSGSGSTCGAASATGNLAPDVNAGPQYTIPMGTPFMLTATGSDPDGDPLTFAWEEFDLGNPAPPDTDDGSRPIFRSFAPVNSPARTFPRLQDILLGTQTFGESLPTTTRTMAFRVTARDNRTGGGGIGSASTAVNVRADAGPFTVTQPTSASGWTTGSSQTVNWTVANTNNAPVSCANVRISLSTDGGSTFPIVLANNTPNDGSETVTIPGLPTTSGRVKVEGAGNIFFNISQSFTIGGASNTAPTINSFGPSSGDVGSSVTINGTNFINPSAVLFNGVSASFTVNSTTEILATVPSGSTSGPITVTTPSGTVVSAGNFIVNTWDVIALTASQAEVKTWTFQGRTYAYIKLLFPNAGYRVGNWGQAVRSGNDFTADAVVEKYSGGSVQAVTTTAQIYDLGPLADGTYTFTFKNSGTVVKSQSFTVSSAVPPPNPIDNAREFVKQQYRDFLNREADQAGEDFWTNNITKCSDPAQRPPGQTEAQCTLRQRETTSGAFFLSPEFQYTGYYVYRMYKGALGRQPKLSEFIPDAQFVGNGIIVGGQLSGAKINQNKADFAAQFVNCTDATKSRCAEFKAIYDGLNNTQYVDKLFQTTGITPTAPERAALIDGLNASPATETRATVLQKVVDGINVISEGNQQFTTSYGQAFYNAEFNRAFVLLEYFGYMKRDPDDAGYAFWLGKLNQFSGNFVNAEMVLAFISSPEYRARFGQP